MKEKYRVLKEYICCLRDGLEEVMFELRSKE